MKNAFLNLGSPNVVLAIHSYLIATT